MSMTFEEQLGMYAELLVTHGLNVQPGQLVNITAEPSHRDFVLKIAESAYQHGAKFVQTDLVDARFERLRLLKSRDEDLSFVPPYSVPRYDYMVDQGAANLRLLGPEDPDVLADLEPKKVNTLRIHQRRALKRFYDEGIGKSRVHWTVGAAATPAWAKKVFPQEKNPDVAYQKLWEAILKACRADRPDCLALWKEHNRKLQKRARALTEMNIKSLRFTGPKTDLTVGLSPKAVFKGGSEKGPHGVEFEPNIPTEEVFTTPDWRETNGVVQTTRPFFINGKLIKDLSLEFKAGKIANFNASEGAETFRAYIESDEGACRLGEVALVGIDSPIYRSGLIFQEILFDENAACHIAVGMAYKFCIDGGERMSTDELNALGCNDSSVHTDMMISSKEVNVQAQTYGCASLTLIQNGEWAWEG